MIRVLDIAPKIIKAGTQITISALGIADNMFPQAENGSVYRLIDDTTDFLNNRTNLQTSDGQIIIDARAGKAAKIPADKEGYNFPTTLDFTNLVGSDGKRSYSIGIKFYISSLSEIRNTRYLFYTGTATDSMGVYMDEITHKVAWVTIKSGIGGTTQTTYTSNTVKTGWNVFLLNRKEAPGSELILNGEYTYVNYATQPTLKSGAGVPVSIIKGAGAAMYIKDVYYSPNRASAQSVEAYVNDSKVLLRLRRGEINIDASSWIAKFQKNATEELLTVNIPPNTVDGVVYTCTIEAAKDTSKTFKIEIRKDIPGTGLNTPIDYEVDYSQGDTGTIVFSIEQNRWRGSDTYQSDKLTNTGNELYSLKKGKLYEHNYHEGQGNTFYGEQYPSEISISVTGDNSKIKTWQTISIEGNKAPNQTNIKDSGENTSLLEAKHYQNREGIYYAAMLRAGDAAQLYNGKRLMGSYIFIINSFEIGNTGKIKLKAINIGFRESAGHEFV